MRCLRCDFDIKVSLHALDLSIDVVSSCLSIGIAYRLDAGGKGGAERGLQVSNLLGDLRNRDLRATCRAATARWMRLYGEPKVAEKGTVVSMQWRVEVAQR